MTSLEPRSGGEHRSLTVSKKEEGRRFTASIKHAEDTVQQLECETKNLMGMHRMRLSRRNGSVYTSKQNGESSIADAQSTPKTQQLLPTIVETSSGTSNSLGPRRDPKTQQQLLTKSESTAVSSRYCTACSESSALAP